MDDAGRDRHGGVHIDKAIDPASGERLSLGRAGRETSGRGLGSAKQLR